MQSHAAPKTNESRPERRVRLAGGPRLRAISRVTWMSVFRGLRIGNEQPSVLDEFQQKLHLNSDTVVAILELAIVVLACVQLEVSSRSPRWRENKVCARLASCVELEDEGSFLLPNISRAAIGLLGIVRLWIRIRFLLKHRGHAQFEGVSWFKRTAACRLYVWEALGVVIFPYPGLELILHRDQANVMVFLSIAVGVRSICWRHILYFPYPIRLKTKVASFAGNLQFTYREFVFKKVMDDHPIRKIVIVTSILFIFTSFLVRAIETLNRSCTSFAEFDGQTFIHARNFHCMAMSWADAMWLVSTSFVMLGFGDVDLESLVSRSVIVMSSCAMRVVAAMLASVVIKKATFSSMEARVHAFLFRMDLFAKKDLSAVMAVQASFRFVKSYRRSLKWHKHQTSLLYYRPLSARLPNEVKNKLYVSRFQSSLKEIMKFNTDGDPMNAFTKHIEVITAALGVTLVKMTQLKKIYWQKNNLLEAQQKQAVAKQYTMTLFTPSQSISQSPSSRKSPPHMLNNVTQLYPPASICDSSSTSVAVVPEEWGQSMVSRCEQVLAELVRIEKSAQSFSLRDRSSSILHTQVDDYIEEN